jgi:hypothetical protein
MVISKEVINAMRACRRLTFVKRNDGKVYMICSDIEIKKLDVKIDKEYETDSDVRFDKFYETCYTSTLNIETCLSFLKPNDSIYIRADKVTLDDTTTFVEIHLRVRRLHPNAGPSKEFDFLLSVTTPKYL